MYDNPPPPILTHYMHTTDMKKIRHSVEFGEKITNSSQNVYGGIQVSTKVWRGNDSQPALTSLRLL